MSSDKEASRKIVARLSKSGKAVLVYNEEGYAFMTSVAWMKMLIEGRARNNMITLNCMDGEATSNFRGLGKESGEDSKQGAPNDKFNKFKVKEVRGNPLTEKADKERMSQRIENHDW